MIAPDRSHRHIFKMKPEPVSGTYYFDEDHELIVPGTEYYEYVREEYVPEPS